MPVYPVINHKTGEKKELNMTLASYDKFRKENPDWDRDWSDPSTLPYTQKYPRAAFISDAIASPTPAGMVDPELENSADFARLKKVTDEGKYGIDNAHPREFGKVAEKAHSDMQKMARLSKPKARKK
tara:strand:- start:304 stop:684 length:381 start_codon:yes stop_codon:yes gene_type:complete